MVRQSAQGWKEKKANEKELFERRRIGGGKGKKVKEGSTSAEAGS